MREREKEKGLPPPPRNINLVNIILLELTTMQSGDVVRIKKTMDLYTVQLVPYTCKFYARFVFLSFF